MTKSSSVIHVSQCSRRAERATSSSWSCPNVNSSITLSLPVSWNRLGVIHGWRREHQQMCARVYKKSEHTSSTNHPPLLYLKCQNGVKDYVVHNAQIYTSDFVLAIYKGRAFWCRWRWRRYGAVRSWRFGAWKWILRRWRRAQVGAVWSLKSALLRARAFKSGEDQENMCNEGSWERCQF